MIPLTIALAPPFSTGLLADVEAVVLLDPRPFEFVDPKPEPKPFEMDEPNPEEPEPKPVLLLFCPKPEVPKPVPKLDAVVLLEKVLLLLIPNPVGT